MTRIKHQGVWILCYHIFIRRRNKIISPRCQDCISSSSAGKIQCTYIDITAGHLYFIFSRFKFPVSSVLKMKVLSLSKQGNFNIAFKSNLFNELKLQRLEGKTDLDGWARLAWPLPTFSVVSITNCQQSNIPNHHLSTTTTWHSPR